MQDIVEGGGGGDEPSFSVQCARDQSVTMYNYVILYIYMYSWGMPIASSPKACPTEKQTHHVIDITISSASIASVKFIAGTRKEQQLLKIGAKYVPLKR